MDIFYLRSFWDLNSTRCYEFGPIPWDIILKYGHHIGLDADIIDTFIAIIRAMDSSFLDWSKGLVDAERKQRAAAAKAKNNTGGRQREPKS